MRHGRKDFTNRRYRYHGQINEIEKAKNRNKSRVRAKVEHVFGVIKNIFGFRKIRYGAWPRTCIDWKSQRRSPICTWSDDGCSERRRRVGGDRECDLELQTAPPTTETWRFGELSSTPFPKSVFIDGSSDLP